MDSKNSSLVENIVREVEVNFKMEVPNSKENFSHLVQIKPLEQSEVDVNPIEEKLQDTLREELANYSLTKDKRRRVKKSYLIHNVTQ